MIIEKEKMEIKQSEQNGCVILSIAGKMDVHFVHKIEDDFNQRIKSLTGDILILDLEGVDYISSSALRIFVNTLKVCKEREIQLRFCSLKPAVVKVLELVEMLSLFEVYPDIPSAIEGKV